MSAGENQRIGGLPEPEFGARLMGPGVGVRIGPFDLHVRARIDEVVAPLHLLYAHYPLLDGERVYSCHVRLDGRWGLRPSPSRRVRFTVDGRVPHEDLPRAQALPVLEWGINLVVAMRFQRYLMLHAGVLERGGRALLLPAAPGQGKTTLCVALAHRGWRLLSDEFGLVLPGTKDLVPAPRPMPLKNESIAVIRAFAPEAVLGPEIHNTRKGTISHVQVPAASIDSDGCVAPARLIVFPRWRPTGGLALEETSQVEGFMMLATNAFNYQLLGAAGFETVRKIVDGARCFRLVYSDLAEAVAALDELAESDAS